MALPRLLQDNLRIPLIGAPMFIVSCPELVIAQCQAGIVGSFPALNARPQARLEDWILQIKDSLVSYAEENPADIVAPFAVNQIVHASNARLQADLDVCIKHEVPIIITSYYDDTIAGDTNAVRGTTAQNLKMTVGLRIPT